MKVTVVGCSGSGPGPTSPASCYLVTAQGGGREWNVLLDLGNGALGVLHDLLDPRRLDAVVLTHLHPDHCLDVCALYVALTYAPGRPRGERMPVWSPVGGAQRLARAYGVVEAEDLGDQFDFRDLAPRRPVRIGPLTITPVPVRHPVETYGLRVDDGTAVLAYSGDTDACPQLGELFAGADLVLVDCAFVDGRDDVRGVHLSGSRAAQAAVDAGGVRRLMLTHLPAWNHPEVCREQAAAIWPGEVEIAAPRGVYRL